MLKRINAIFDGVISFLAYFGCVLIAFIVLSIGADVLMRYFFNKPIIWANAVTEYIQATITFLAAAWVLREEAHISLDAVTGRLNPRTRAAINTITSILCAITCGVLCWYGAWNAWDHFQKGSIIVQKAPYVPKAPLIAGLPIGFFLFAIQFLRRSYGFLRIWRGMPKEEKKRVEELAA
ncbi:TRAP transporter small permease [Chloroflexota bacterium]